MRAEPIPGHRGYRASTDGTIESSMGRRARGWYRLNPSTTSAGYQMLVILRDDGTRRSVRVHTLVLETFVGSRPAGMEACHANGDPADNRLDNLRWDTRLGNESDKAAHGRRTIGERHGQHRLTDADVVEIRTRFVPGRNRYDRGNKTELAAQYGMAAETIVRICSGRARSAVLL